MSSQPALGGSAYTAWLHLMSVVVLAGHPAESAPQDVDAGCACT